MIPSFGGNLLT